jgi:hypothetical protein
VEESGWAAGPACRAEPMLGCCCPPGTRWAPAEHGSALQIRIPAAASPPTCCRPDSDNVARSPPHAAAPPFLRIRQRLRRLALGVGLLPRGVWSGAWPQLTASGSSAAPD